MAVLTEGTSVVVRVDAIRRVMEEDVSPFEALVPNQTLCCDNELARIGFMDPRDVEAFIRVLEQHGFRHLDTDGAALDLVAIDQFQGPMSPCDWVEWGSHTMNTAGERIRLCRLKGSQEGRYFTPDGWTFVGSLSQQSGFQPLEGFDCRYRFLRNESGLDVYFDTTTGKEVYVGRVDQ